MRLVIFVIIAMVLSSIMTGVAGIMCGKKEITECTWTQYAMLGNCVLLLSVILAIAKFDPLNLIEYN